MNFNEKKEMGMVELNAFIDSLSSYPQYRGRALVSPWVHRCFRSTQQVRTLATHSERQISEYTKGAARAITGR